MRFNRWNDAWSGALIVAAIYVYFLIFAQFAFLARLGALGIAGSSLKTILAAMAAGGILFSLLSPRLSWPVSPVRKLRIGLGVCAVAALCALGRLDWPGAAVVAFLIGAGIGTTTVTLVTHLNSWTGSRNGILKVGLGTGGGYLLCNIPKIFTASPERQCVFATLVVLCAMAVPLREPENDISPLPLRRRDLSFPVALTAFGALIWLDSAAFYIIQHAPLLKASTWMGVAHLWTNGALHFAAALGAAFLLARGRLSIVLACAIGALGFACALLHHPELVLSASVLYPVGVSFYSVALVAYPSFLSSARSARERGLQAGWIYALAGWVGSALGIGMGQNLGQMPLPFVVVAGVVVLAPVLLDLVRSRTREVILLGSVMLMASVIYRALPNEATSGSLTSIERGRQVYISEGCISCHSQYVRPNSADTLMWGPTQSLEQIHELRPPLIGNRRQGPDLAQVGARRSRFWLRAHLINPREFSDRSIMPAYAFLFSDRRGDDLVAYLVSLQSPDQQSHVAQEMTWHPRGVSDRQIGLEEGRASYARNCATCHDQDGSARQQYRAELAKGSTELTGMITNRPAYPFEHLSQIIKFGIPGTEMPGHEYLSDEEIARLAQFLTRSSLRPITP